MISHVQIEVINSNKTSDFSENPNNKRFCLKKKKDNLNIMCFPLKKNMDNLVIFSKLNKQEKNCHETTIKAFHNTKKELNNKDEKKIFVL